MKQSNEIQQGLHDYEDINKEQKDAPLLREYYNNLSREELLKKYQQAIKLAEDNREAFEKQIDIERAQGTDAGKTYIGDDKVLMEEIRIMEEIMDQRRMEY